MTRCTRPSCPHTAEPAKTVTGEPLCHRHATDERWAMRAGQKRYDRNARMPVNMPGDWV